MAHQHAKRHPRSSSFMSKQAWATIIIVLLHGQDGCKGQVVMNLTVQTSNAAKGQQDKVSRAYDLRGSKLDPVLNRLLNLGLISKFRSALSSLPWHLRAAAATLQQRSRPGHSRTQSFKSGPFEDDHQAQPAKGSAGTVLLWRRNERQAAYPPLRSLLQSSLEVAPSPTALEAPATQRSSQVQIAPAQSFPAISIPDEAQPFIFVMKVGISLGMLLTCAACHVKLSSDMHRCMSIEIF